MPQPNAGILDQYAALTAGCGVVSLDRTQIEFLGADRATFLHNLCTNEVKKLQPGEAREAFITNVQGHTIGHGYVFCRADSLIFDTTAAQGELLLRHFEKYHVREKVEILDRTNDWCEWLVAGSGACDLFARSAAISEPAAWFEEARQAAPLGNLDAHLDGIAVSIRRTGFCGPNSYFLSAPRESSGQIINLLLSVGAKECTPEALEIARLEAGTPLFGRDITERNLPQEVNRDARAISFTKGCYLGQETVARIDALGHVNQKLVGLCFRGASAAPAGLALLAADKAVGHVTSSAWSVRLAAPLALAYIRREHLAVGAVLQSTAGEAEVVSLPA